MTIDMAIMFGMLELAAGRVCVVSKTMYVYNMANSINDFRVNEVCVGKEGAGGWKGGVSRQEGGRGGLSTI